MTWKKPMFPRQLSTSFVVSSFNRMRKRELGETLKGICMPLYDQHRTTQWRLIEMKDLFRYKLIDRFEKESFQKIFDDARAVVNGDCTTLVELCEEVRNQILSIEKEESDEGAKKLLLEMSEQADLLIQGLNKEAMEEHVQTLYDQHMATLNKQLEQRFQILKKDIVKIVEGIKKVIELEFDASSETDTVNGALAFAYSGIQSSIKNFAAFLEKGLGDISIETYKENLEPLTKFSNDESLYTFDSYSDFYERDTKMVAGEDADAEDVKKHCISILQAVRALPSRYKE